MKWIEYAKIVFKNKLDVLQGIFKQRFQVSSIRKFFQNNFLCNITYRTLPSCLLLIALTHLEELRPYWGICMTASNIVLIEAIYLSKKSLSWLGNTNKRCNVNLAFYKCHKHSVLKLIKRAFISSRDVHWNENVGFPSLPWDSHGNGNQIV